MNTGFTNANFKEKVSKDYAVKDPNRKTIACQTLCLNPKSRKSFLISFSFLCNLIIGVVLTAITINVHAQYNDLPNPPVNIQTIPVGSLVIPMDNAHQNLTPPQPFNLKSYGLINALLQNDIPVKWVILSGKAKDGIDFSANAERIKPTFIAAAMQDFRASAFIIDTTWINRPYYSFGQTAMQVINSFGGKVAVYRLMQNTNVNVRYVLNQRPKIAVFNNGGCQNIHTRILDTARFNSYVEINAGVFTGLAECYTFCSEPHWKSTDASDTAITGRVWDFVMSGGNFFAQCAGVNTYENDQQAPHHFHTTNGITIINTNVTNAYYNPDLAIMQFQGIVVSNPGGSEQNWIRKAGSNWLPVFYNAISPSPNNDTIVLGGAHLQLPDSTGGNVTYMGGHNYMNNNADWNDITCVNAARVYLNAALVPSNRGTGFTLDVGANRTICNGQSTVLGGTPTGPSSVIYTWTPAASLNNPNSANPIATPTVTTTYTITGMNGSCPGGPFYVKVIVKTTPNAPVAASNGPLCAGQTLNLTASNIAGATYSWTGPNGFTSSLQNPTISGVTPAAAGVYNVIATVNGCPSSTAGTVNVTVNSIPAAPVASSNSPLCVGQTLNLSANNITGATYSWTGPNGFTSSSQNPSITGVTMAASGVYSVTATVLGCTSPAGTVIVVVNPIPPAPVASSNSPLCEGQTLNLTAGNITGATYNWTGPDGFTSLLQNPSIINVTPAATGVYTVTATVSGCTSPPATVIVIVNSTPPAPVTGSNSPVCQGQTLSFTASNIAGAAYSWTGPNGFTSLLQNPSIIGATPAATGTYSVTATVNGCAGPAGLISAIVHSGPTANAGNDINIGGCPGSPGANINGSGTGSMPVSYCWKPACGLNDSTVATPVAHPSVTTTYTLTVTDIFGCSASDAVTIFVALPLTSAITTATNVSCFAGSNGSATVTASGGTIPYIYIWSSGGTNATENNLPAGSYSVTITDQYGCTASSSVTVTQPTVLTSVISGSSNVSCFGGNNGSASVVANGGTVPYNYLWSDGGNTATITNLIANNYIVTVTDNLGCPATASVIITEPSLFTLAIGSQTNVSCFGGNNGSATVNANGGTTPYSYLWPSGGTNPTENNLAAGTYTITITDAHLCSVISNITITQPAVLTSVIAGKTDVSCYGGNNGFASVNASGGTTPYSYNWSNGMTTQSISVLIAGSYNVTVTDLHGCTSTTSVTITEPGLLTSSITSAHDVSCFGGSDGTATVTANGGSLPYSYLWSSGGTNNIKLGLAPGTYSVTVTDANGCTTTASANIAQPALIQSTISSSSNVSCFGGSDGQATVIGTGGTPPYVYFWSTWEFTATITNLDSGTYYVTVSDDNGCMAISSVIITEPPLLVAGINSINNISCFGFNNGSATVTASGGTLPYSYQWSSGGTNATESALTAGTYTVTVTDARFCTTLLTVTLTEPAQLTSAVASATGVHCFGGNDGTASVSASGGTVPYDYNWSNGMITSSITGLASGTYNLTITDIQGCISTNTVVISEPALLTAAITGNHNISCMGGSDGTATVTAGGGISPYTYLWSSGGTLNIETGLSTGIYFVTVSDANGCSATDSVSIFQPALMQSTISSLTDISCFGGNDGQATVSATGGVSPYAYTWSNGGLTASISNLTSGTYIVTVSDVNGCTAISSAVITEPSLLIANISSVNNAGCFGFNNGSATVSLPGGTAPYSYLWSTGGTGATENNMTAGMYTVTITDARSCTASASVTITEPVLLTSAAGAGSDVNCFGGNNGAASVIVNGGTIPYSYLWSNSMTTSSITGLTSASYDVTVTDAQGCTSATTVFINEPGAITSAITGGHDVSCFGGGDGTAIVTANGSVPPYTYLWSSGGTGNIETGLTTGTYFVTVTDTHGCTTNASINISQPALLLSAISSAINISCFGSNDGQATVTGTGGTAPYAYTWSDGEFTASITNLNSGIYRVTITDVNGCSDTSSVTMTEPAILLANISSINNVSCFGLSNGDATVSVSGGTTPYLYQWSSGGVLDFESGLIAGTYTVTITDHNNCTAGASVTLSQPALLISSIPLSTDVSCFGEHNGSAEVNASGGTIPYTYNWSNATTTAIIDSLTAGMYSVTTTDGNGCTDISTVTITQPLLLTATISSSANVGCFSDSSGSATVTAAGGVLPYSYLWDNGATVPVLNNLPAGAYNTTITDMNGCSAGTMVVVSQPSLLAAAVSSGNNVSCFGMSDGSASVSANGGVLPYTYHWTSGGAQDSIHNIPAGTYEVTVTDANGCNASSQVNITEPGLLSSAITSFTTVNCFGGNDGNAVVLASGGISPYDYLWSNGYTTDTITNLTAGNYDITVTDNHGCTTTTGALVSQPPQITVTTTIASTISCFGSSDGSALANVSGGVQPYQYMWSGGQAGTIISGLSTGTYEVTITDNNGCSVSASVNVPQPGPLTANISSYSNVSCYNGTNGTASALVSGGTAPYLYTWSDSTHAAYHSGLIAGTYGVTISDLNGCTSSSDITLTQPPPLSASLTGSDVLCNGGHSGFAIATVAGGTGPYNYIWTPSGGNAQTAQNLHAGTYTVLVVDVNGCHLFQNVTINEPPLLLAALANQQNVHCFGGKDGFATIIAHDGTPPYSYLWTTTGQTADSADSLMAGNYPVVITDSNGCMANINVHITQPLPVTLSVSGDTTLCKGISANIFANASGGTVPYTYMWDIGTGQYQLVQVMGDTTFSVSVTDRNGCPGNPDSVKMNIYPELTVLAGGPSDICQGASAVLTAVAQGGTGGPYAYEWNNGIGAIDPPIYVTPDTTTTYIVGVNSNCGSYIVFDTITVVVHPVPVPHITADKLGSCEAFPVNFSELTLPPYASYNWDFGDPYSGAENHSSDQNPSHFYSNTGNYSVTLSVTNSFGCPVTQTYHDLIWVYHKPVADFEWNPEDITIEDPEVRFTNLSIDDDLHHWCFGDEGSGALNFSDQDEPGHLYPALEGTHHVWLAVENQYGCTDTASKEINIQGIWTFFAPTAFSPNGDGTNDYFIPKSTNLDYSTFEFYVYDRWGELIYYTTNPDSPWDGHAKGGKDVVQQEVYVWVVNVNEKKGRQHQFMGTVTVIE